MMQGYLDNNLKSYSKGFRITQMLGHNTANFIPTVRNSYQISADVNSLSRPYLAQGSVLAVQNVLEHTMTELF